MSNFIKGNKLAILFLLITAPLLPQGWNSIQQTTIPFSLYSKLDLCTNTKGNNVLITYRDYPTYYLKYYLISTSGSVVRSYQFETQEVEFASIDGNNDKVYVVYKLGNNIKTRKSTNAGLSWANIYDINIGNNTCNNVDVTWGKDDGALHVVWATQDAGNDYKTYYKKLQANDQWTITEDVTDGDYVGGFPTVSKSNNRVHVSYNTGQYADPYGNVGDAKSRDKYYNNWQNPQLIFSTYSFRERIHAGISKLFDFYYKYEEGLGDYHADLYVKERDLDDTDWSSGTLLDYFADPAAIVSATNTYDNITHIIYPNGDGAGYRSYSGTNWSSESTVINTNIAASISSVSNDLYVISGGSDYIYFRQYDTNPLAPQNLQITKSQNNHPYLSWSANTEPDLNHYLVKKYDDGWTSFSTTVTHYEDVTETFCTAQPPEQCTDGHTISYYVVAVDNNSYISPLSNEVKAFINGPDPSKAISQQQQNITDLEYTLGQNYPNPFNPSTSINYQIKNKGLVSLKVYDMLGREIAVLVNETQDQGQYSVMFDAANLPSGVYIYSLRVNDFVQNNKMTLMK